MNTLKAKLRRPLHIAVLCISTIMTFTVSYASSDYWIPGDANNDGQVDIVDALLVAQYYVGVNMTEIYALNSEVNGDLVIDIVDALLIAQHYVGLITLFPVETTIHNFVDAKAESAARHSLNKDAYDAVYKWDLRRIQSLSMTGSSSSLDNVDLSDIEQMMALSNLKVNNSAILDLAPLYRLGELQKPKIAGDADDVIPPEFYTNLTSLDLNNTNISDLNFLIEMTSLKKLVLANNRIADFNPLANLADLTLLDLDNTGIANLDPLTAMANLKYLNLNNNGISDVHQLAYFPLLKDLKIRNNAIDNAGFQVISNLSSLLSLDIGRNNISDITPYTNFDSLEIFDIRGNGIYDVSLFFPKGGLRKLDIFSCNPGNYRGDANADGYITNEDVDMVKAILSYLEPNGGYRLEPPDNIECIDMNGNGNIDAGDVAILENMVSTGSGEIFGFSFNACGIKGDADGDGTVALDDADLIDDLPSGIVGVSSDITCVDMNSDGLLDETDGDMIRELAKRREPLHVLYKPYSDSSISIVTYDHDNYRWGPIGGEATAKTPDGAIDELHDKILSDPFLQGTDLVLMNEFAYADSGNCIELIDNGEGVHPRYKITNDNPIVKKVERLMQLAADNKLNIVVSVIEKLFHNECPINFNSALVITSQGHIDYVRRKTHKVLCENPPADIDTFCMHTHNNSYEVMELTNRKGELFTAILIICAEMDKDTLRPDIAKAINDYTQDKEKKTIDLLLFIENIFSIFPAAELVKRIQADAWNPNDYFHVFNYTEVYRGIVDFLAYSGGWLNSQGVYNMDKQPIEYIYPNRFDNTGCIYSRLKLKRD